MKHSILTFRVWGGQFLILFLMIFGHSVVRSQHDQVKSVYDDKGTIKTDTFIPQAIIGGSFSNTSPGYIVSLFNGNSFLGAGVIIDSKTILTAAHIVDNFYQAPHFITVKAGSPFLSVSSQESAASQLIVHPNFICDFHNFDPCPNDIALLKLQTPFTLDANVKRIKLVNECDGSLSSLVYGKNTTIHGWGATAVGSTSNAGALKQTSQPVFNVQTSSFWASEPYYSQHFVSPGMFAIHDPNSQAYSGDSGGPCVIQNDNVNYLVGIISWGRFPELSNDPSLLYPTVLTDVAHNYDFIFNNMEITCQNLSKPVLSNGEVNLCGKSMDLNQYRTGGLPQGSTIIWSTDCDPSDGLNAPFNGVIQTPGIYYVYFYDPTKNCYSRHNKIIVKATCQNIGDVVINSSISLSTDNTYFSIHVKNNSTLTIPANVTLKIVDRIIVDAGSKLILNGKLTKCDNCNSWKGVEVFGKEVFYQQLPSGEVEMNSNAIIEYAEVGINATPSANQSTTQYPGGKVTISSGAIKECSLGVKFGQNGNFFNVQDPSTIFGCTFTNCLQGISLFRNRGVTIQNCIFQTLPPSVSYAGIKSVNSTFKCKTSQFYHFEYGILFENLYPNSDAFDATGCTFAECEVGIYNGSVDNLVKGNINTCDFLGNKGAGIDSRGICDIDISSNTFIGNGSEFSVGGLSSWFTNDASLVRDNQFVSNQYGHLADGDNKLIYLTNCHEYNAESDMDVAGNVFPQQGDEFDAASNSFSKFGIPSITSNHNFDYYIQNGTHYSSPKYPQENGFNRVFKGLFQQLDCGSGFTLPTIPSRYNWWLCPPVGTFLVFQTIQDLKSQKQAILNNTGLDPRIKAILIARLDMCLKKLKEQYVNDTKNNSDGKTTVINFLKSDENFSQRATAYGLMVDEGHYQAARSFLAIIAPENQGEVDFVNSQYIVLDVLEGVRDQHSFSPSELINIESTGMARNPYSGFGRTLYKHATGILLQPAYQYAAQPSPRSKDISQPSESAIKCYPNPVKENIIHIDLPNSNNKAMFEAKFMDMNGNVKKQTLIKNEQNELDISEINAGIYILLISDNDQNIIFTQKIVKI